MTVWPRLAKPFPRSPTFVSTENGRGAVISRRRNTVLFCVTYPCRENSLLEHSLINLHLIRGRDDEKNCRSLTGTHVLISKTHSATFAAGQHLLSPPELSCPSRAQSAFNFKIQRDRLTGVEISTCQHCILLTCLYSQLGHFNCPSNHSFPTSLRLSAVLSGRMAHGYFTPL